MRTLYHLWLHPSSRKVRIALAEKKLDFDLKIEKVKKSENKENNKKVNIFVE